MALALLILLLVLVGLWIWAKRAAGRSQLPEGDVFYRDTQREDLESPLFSERHGLVGRPDYLLRTAEGLVVVEVKKCRCPGSGPYESHLAQLFGYWLLVEDALNETVAHGILRYADREVRVEFTPAQRAWVLQVIAGIAGARQSGAVSRNHASPGRCRGCSVREGCGEALA